jgi:hypothetical protein
MDITVTKKEDGTFTIENVPEGTALMTALVLAAATAATFGLPVEARRFAQASIEIGEWVGALRLVNELSVAGAEISAEDAAALREELAGIEAHLQELMAEAEVA